MNIRNSRSENYGSKRRSKLRPGLCRALFVGLAIGSLMACDAATTDSQSSNSQQTPKTKQTVLELLDAGLSPEQRIERDKVARNATSKSLTEVRKSLEETNVTIGKDKLSDLEKLVFETVSIQWSMERVYKKRARKHGESQLEAGQKRLEELKDKTDVILEPLNVAIREDSQEKLRQIFEADRLEKEAIARGETINRPELKPYIRKVLTADEKTDMRTKGLEKLTKLMEESGLTLSQSDIEHYLGYGERSHDRMEILQEQQYYRRQGGGRNNQDLPGSENYMASLTQSLDDSNRLSLITRPLEIARLENMKSKILKKKSQQFREKFLEARYDFKESDVVRMSEISWELERIRHERRLSLALNQKEGRKGIDEKVSRIDAKKRVLERERADLEYRLYSGG